MRMLVWPLLVVFVLTVAWVGIRSMTAAPPDVDAAIRAIHEDGNTPWRTAILLEALRRPSGASMRTDPALALRVAELLQHELDVAADEGEADENAATVRTYLCRGLAEFEVDEGLGVLLHVVKNQTDTAQADEPNSAAGRTRQETVMLGALAASELLVKNNPRLDARRIEQAVARLAHGESDTPPEARRRAAELLKQW